MALERRYEPGGGLATEEITLPGYFHNTHAIYMMMVWTTHPFIRILIRGPGYNAANQIAEDLGASRWWKESPLVTSAKEKGLL